MPHAMAFGQTVEPSVQSEDDEALAVAKRILELTEQKSVLLAAIDESILKADHFASMPPDKRARFAALAREEFESDWPKIALKLSQDLTLSFDLNELKDIEAFVSLPVVRRIFQQLAKGDRSVLNTPIDAASAQQIRQYRQKPAIDRFLSLGINPYIVQSHIEAILARALSRLETE